MAHSSSRIMLLLPVLLVCLLGGIWVKADDAENSTVADSTTLPPPSSSPSTPPVTDPTSTVGVRPQSGGAQKKMEEENRCAFYCFFSSINDEKINMSHYKNLTGCTHLVYGFAEIDTRNEIEHPTSYDILHDDYYGNYKLITSFRYAPINPMKMLYGVRVLNGSDFVGKPEQHREVADEIVWWARHTRFQGIYLDMDKRSLNSPKFGEWMKALNESMEDDGKRFTARLSLVLAVSAAYVPTFYEEAPNYDSMVEAFYLIMDEIPTSSHPNKAAVVDPLYATTAVGERETIQWVAEKFASSKIPKHKVIIGLTAWARSYALPANSGSGGHGAPALRFGQPGNRTHSNDGRLAYDELCRARGFDPTHDGYDANSCTTTFSDNQTSYWYSYNAPQHASLDRKLKWISSHGFGGVGLSSIQGDDLNGTCDEGPLPLHNSILELFQCTKQYGGGGGRGPAAASGGPKCIRMCIVNLEQQNLNFNFSLIQPNWCSHIIVQSVNIALSQNVVPSAALSRAVIDYNAWVVEPKPYLILSLGDLQSAEYWRQTTYNEKGRQALAEKVRQTLADYNADGVCVSWTKIPIDKIAEANAYNEFLTQLRSVLGPEPQIVVATAHSSLFAGHYNVTTLNSTVDYVIAQGHRFYSHTRHFTGHHSPLFGNHEKLLDPRHTIQGVLGEWKSKGLAESKLVMGLSAEGMSMFFANPNVRIDKQIGDKADLSKAENRLRSFGPGTVTQTEVCEVIKNGTARRVYIEELGVPYLINGAEFIAYDDVQSMQTKTIWGTLQPIGGIALYGLEMDNPEGICPAKKPFPMLKTIVDTHICEMCQLRPSTAMAANGTLPKNVTTANTNCKPAFPIACYYSLPQSSDEDPLDPTDIPFQQCDEIIVEGAVLDPNGELNYHDGQAVSYLRELRKIANRPKGRRLISSIRCQAMKAAEFDQVLGQRHQMREKIKQHMEIYGFSGIEFRCNHLLRGSKNKDRFRSLLDEIAVVFEQEDQNKTDQCPRSVSIRIPVYERNLTVNYDVNSLKKLHRVVLESFQVTASSPKNVQLLNPLFLVGSQRKEQHSINDTLGAWFKAGLKPVNVMVQIPAYGILQKPIMPPASNTSKAMHTAELIGAQVAESSSLDVLSMKKICKRTKEAGSVTSVMYAEMSAIGSTSTDEWMSFETHETITYKMKYLMAEGLAGVGIVTINDDDRDGDCAMGKFLVLQTILRNKCSVSRNSTTESANDS